MTEKTGKAKIIFIVFSLLFQPLYFLMLLMYFDELQHEENTLARRLDIAILALGLLFMLMQGCMLFMVGRPHRHPALKKLFYLGLVVWFFLEVFFSYWWCFVTGADPLLEHTPFVLIFLLFNVAQYQSLKKLGVLG